MKLEAQIVRRQLLNKLANIKSFYLSNYCYGKSFAANSLHRNTYKRQENIYEGKGHLFEYNIIQQKLERNFSKFYIFKRH